MDRVTGRYDDVLDRASELSDLYGSATNALAHLARTSPNFTEAKDALRPSKPAARKRRVR